MTGVLALTLLLLTYSLSLSFTSFQAGLAPTIAGSGCAKGQTAHPLYDLYNDQEDIQTCAITFRETNTSSMVLSCDYLTDQQVPGSNLYLGAWSGLAFALMVGFRWKVQQAISFAQAQQAKKQQQQQQQLSAAQQDQHHQSAFSGDVGIDDDVDDFDDFHDAAY